MDRRELLHPDRTEDIFWTTAEIICWTTKARNCGRVEAVTLS
jgi:hypothetical protein